MLDTPLEKLSLVAFDLETTGLTLAADRVVEIGAVRFSLAAHEPSTFSMLVNPHLQMKPEIIAIHHISQDMADAALPAKQVLPQFIAWLQEKETLPVMIAHHAAFDISFLMQEARRVDIELPELYVIDTFPLARQCFPGLPSYSLQNLLTTLELPTNSNAHRALPDAVACQMLFQACVLKHQLGKLSLGDFYQKYPRTRLSTHETPAETEVFAALQRAILKQKDVEITYLNSRKKKNTRSITPQLLGGYGSEQYVDAYCHLRKTRRRFYLKRIVEYKIGLIKS